MCMPRTVPRRSFREMLACTSASAIPCARNSRAQNVRAKKPRSSACASISITNTPLIGVSRNRMSGPVELAVDLPGALQILELLQAGERAELVSLRLHVDALEDFAELPRAIARGEAALEARQLAVNL